MEVIKNKVQTKLIVFLVLLVFSYSLVSATFPIDPHLVNRTGSIAISDGTNSWINFDGSTGQIIVDDADQLDISSEATWNIWVKQNEYKLHSGIFGKYSANTGKRSYIIRTVLTNAISLIISPDGVNTQTMTSSSNKFCGIRNNNEWTMITVTYSGSTVSFYNNGIFCESKSTSVFSIYNSPQQLSIGGGNGVFFDGSVDEAKIYPIALSSKQVADLYLQSSHAIIPEQSIPILAYHKIEDPADQRTVVSISSFNEQMQYLHDQGFQSITLKDYNDWKKGLFDMPAKPIIITFDDNFQSQYNNAFPIMESHGLVGTINIVTRYAGFTNPNSNYMNWVEMQELKDNGWDMESHSITHSNMLALNESQFRNELNTSLQLIAEHYNVTPTSFTFPYHSANEAYTTICGEYYDLCWTFGSEPDNPVYVAKSTDGKTYRSLKRNNIYNTVTMDMFKNIVDKGGPSSPIPSPNVNWEMNEGFGDIVHDSAGFSRDGTLVGGYSWEII